MDANETGHIWLRQTVTFTVDGQTRTLEIGIPVPSDATTQDVEALLEVADAGMSALSRRLDTRVAEVLSGTHDDIPALPLPESAQEAASANGHMAAAPESVTSEPESVAEPPVEHAHATGEARIPMPKAPERQTRPVQPQPATTPERSIPAQPPQRSEAPRTKTPVAAPATSAEMTRPEFLAAAAGLGLNPRQAMDRLGVRSLEGLNLREALESLRRQLLGVSSYDEPEPEPEPDVAPEPVRGASSSVGASPVASRFEEEDDETIFYALDEDDELSEDDFASAPAGNAANPVASGDALDEMDDEDEIDLDDVPDLSPPPAPSRSRTTSAGRKSTSAASETPAPAHDAPAATSASGARTQAMRLIGKLRSATGGGTASDYQRNAYRNIVENELGRTRAVALVRGLWRTTADHLTSGQLDALIRWGKEEVFAEEAEQVLAALRAEQQRADQEAASANGPDTPAAPRTAPRGRPAGGTR